MATGCCHAQRKSHEGLGLSQVSADEKAAGLDFKAFRNYSATVPREFRLIYEAVKQLLQKESKDAGTDIAAKTSVGAAYVRPNIAFESIMR